jgi:hypothetical protein
VYTIIWGIDRDVIENAGFCADPSRRRQRWA